MYNIIFPLALTDCKLWAIERHCFQTIMMKTGLMRQRQYMDFLKTVPLLAELPDETIIKIVDVLEEVLFLNRIIINDKSIMIKHALFNDFIV